MKPIGEQDMIMQLDSVCPEPIAWIWTDRVARGMITIFEGHPGEGKSLLTLALAASVSAGRSGPGEIVCRLPGRVFLVCPEDDPATTVVPRLNAFEGNLRNIVVPDDQDLRAMNDDASLLGKMIARVQPDLVIVDPVKAIISHSSDNLVRMNLECWRQAALDANAGIILVRHLTKSATGHIGLQGCGSVAYQAVARFVFRIEAHPFESDQRLVVPIKSNLLKSPPLAAFRLLGEESSCGIDWFTTVPEGLASRRRGSCPKLAHAIRFVISELKDGPVQTKAIQKRAKDAFIVPKTLRDATEMIGVIHRKVGGRGVSFWTMELPCNETTARLVMVTKDEEIGFLVQDLIHGNRLLDELAKNGQGSDHTRPRPESEGAPE